MSKLLWLLNGRGKSIPATARLSFYQGHYSTSGTMQTFSDLFTTTRGSKSWDVVNGALVEYAINEPMLSSKGLGVWDTATNNLVKSNDFAAATTQWIGGANFTTTTATSIGDSLGLTAYKLTNTGTGTFKSRYQSTGSLAASAETLYFIVENVDATVTALSIYDATVAGHVIQAEFTWATKNIAVIDSAAGSSVSANATKISDTGPNGGETYLISVTGTPNNPGNSTLRLIYATGLGTNTESVIVHHGQHCVSGFVSPPILTDAAAVTRAADIVANNAAITSWYNDSEGTIYAECNTALEDTSVYTQFDNGTNSSRHACSYGAASVVSVVTQDGGALSALISDTVAGAYSGVKSAYAYKSNDFEQVIDGASVGTDVSGTVPTGIDALRLGGRVTGDFPLNGYLRDLRYYNTRLTQADMVTITS